MHQCPDCTARGRGPYCTLAGDLLAGLNRNKSPHTYRSGQVVFHEGAPALAVYCIQSGLVKLHKSGPAEREIMLRMLRPGDILGYRAVLAEEPFAATAVAVGEATVCTIPRDSFCRILREDPDLNRHMMGRLARELRLSEEELVFQLHHSVAQRTARLLLELANGDGTRSDSRTVLPVKREDIAAMVGTTPETLSRTLHDLERRRVLALSRRSIEIQDEEELTRIASDPRT